MATSNKKTFRIPNDQAKGCIGLRESTKDERRKWEQNAIESGLDLLNSAGEFIIPPQIAHVRLHERTWEIVALRCKVPFNGYDYKPLTGFGLIKDVENGEEAYVNSAIIKVCKENWLIK